MKNTIKRLNTQGFSPLVVLVILALLVLAGSIGYVYYGQKQEGEIPQPLESGRQTTVPQPPSPQSDETTDWKTYRSEKYSFSFKYPIEWNIIVKENDLSLGSLVSIKFTNKSTNDQFLSLVGCFGGMNAVDPFYLGDFRTSEPITIDGVAISIYRDQNRGLETLRFYVPLIRQDSKRCGIFFQGFTDLNETKKDIITSLDFINGFDSFIDAVIKQLEIRPPTKG